VLLKLINPKVTSKDKSIPLSVLKGAKGIAFVTSLKGGFVFTGTVGSGIVIAKLDDGTWSGPTSVGQAGMGWGLQIGGSSTDSVIILNTSMAVKAFSGTGQVKFGGNLSIAAGPLGRDADAAVSAGDGGVAACYSYSHSRGAFAGLSLQGSVLFARDSDNTKFYGRKVKPSEILKGLVHPPDNEDLRLLYQTLRVITHSETSNFEYRDSQTGSLRGAFGAADMDNDQSMAGHASYYEEDPSLGPAVPTHTASTGGIPEAHAYEPPMASGLSVNHAQSSPAFATPVAAPAPSTTAGLPPGWRELKTDDGQVYYWNEEQNLTQWDKPAPVAPPAPPPPAPPPAAPARAAAPAPLAQAPASASAPPGNNLASELAQRLSMRAPTQQEQAQAGAVYDAVAALPPQQQQQVVNAAASATRGQRDEFLSSQLDRCRNSATSIGSGCSCRGAPAGVRAGGRSGSQRAGNGPDAARRIPDARGL
ncbi:SH3 domain-containing protein PJ696.02, partial [Durusdinium trenchii]